MRSRSALHHISSFELGSTTSGQSLRDTVVITVVTAFAACSHIIFWNFDQTLPHWFRPWGWAISGAFIFATTSLAIDKGRARQAMGTLAALLVAASFPPLVHLACRKLGLYDLTKEPTLVHLWPFLIFTLAALSAVPILAHYILLAHANDRPKQRQ